MAGIAIIKAIAGKIASTTTTAALAALGLAAGGNPTLGDITADRLKIGDATIEGQSGDQFKIIGGGSSAIVMDLFVAAARYARFNTGGWDILSTARYAWSGGGGVGSPDTHMNRQNAGHVGIGTTGSGIDGILSIGRLQVGVFAKASLPSAATAGGVIYVSDDVGGAVLAFSDGTNWRRVTDRAVIA